jgi:hypothetical protein
VTVNGIQSNPGYVYVVTPDAPIISTEPSPGIQSTSCNSVTSFSVWAYVLNNSLNPIANAKMNVSISGIVATLTTDISGNPGLFTGLWQDLQPNVGTVPYLVSVTYQAQTTTVPLGPKPIYFPLRCKLSASITSGITGSIVRDNPTCYSCVITDIPLVGDNSKYYINDLTSIGVLRITGTQFSPEKIVSVSEFLNSLQKLLPRSLKGRIPNLGTPVSNKSLTRETAARIGASFLALPGALSTTKNYADILVASHFLSPVSGVSAGEQGLTRIEMVNILWHIAAQKLAVAHL